MPIQLSPQAHVSTIGVWSSDKYPFFQRLPTLLKRSVSALKIFSHSMKELVSDRLDRRHLKLS